MLTGLLGLYAHSLIVEYFRAVADKKRTSRGNDIFSINVPVGIEIDADQFAEAVELRIWERIAQLSWRLFEEARAYAQSLNLGNVKEWQAWSSSGQRPPDESVHREPRGVVTVAKSLKRTTFLMRVSTGPYAAQPLRE